MTIILAMKKIFCCYRQPEIKVVIIGLDNAGKTTLLYKLGGEHVTTMPTIGYNVEEIRWKDFKFIMWDVGGQKALRQSWNTYYSNAAAIIIVLDSTDEAQIPALRTELECILRNDELENAAILIFANKQDLPGTMTDISQKLGLTTSVKHNWRVQNCSALTGTGLSEGLDWLSSVLPRN